MSEISEALDRGRRLLVAWTFVIVCAIAVGLVVMGQELRRGTRMGADILAALDSAKAAAVTSREAAARGDSIRDEMKAGVDSILRTLAQRSESNRAFQREQTRLLRREVGTVRAVVDSVHDALPPRKGRR